MRVMETMPAGSPAYVDKQEAMKAKPVSSKYCSSRLNRIRLVLYGLCYEVT